MKEIAKAVIAVMNEVKGIEKSMTVGSGNNSYKGVADQDVKQIIGDAMAKHGLCIIPTSIDAKTQVDRWEELDSYSKTGAMKTKQSIFTEVKSKYLLLHESGESIELSGYGHGIDSQDKGAGKATTYALKYALLYTFLVPTGKIDDTDNHHSDTLPKPVKVVQTESFDDLHSMYMGIWQEYKSATNTEEATKFHPSRWKNKDAKSYEYAIKSLSEKLETLKQK